MAVKPLITAMPLSRATEPRGWEARERRGAFLGGGPGERDGERAAIEAARCVDAAERALDVEAATRLPQATGGGKAELERPWSKPPARQATEREE